MERRIQSAKLEKRQTHQLLPETPPQDDQYHQNHGANISLHQQKQHLINRVAGADGPGSSQKKLN